MSCCSCTRANDGCTCFCQRILEDCYQFILLRANNVVGIFHSTANMTQVKQLFQDYLRGESVNLDEVKNAHVVATLLVYYLRERQKPLFPYELYDEIVQLGETAEQVSIENHQLIQLIRRSKDQKESLKIIFGLLHAVASGSEINKASFQSLAQTFAPLLCKPEGCAFMSLKHLKSLPQIQLVIQAFIERYQQIFLMEHYQNIHKEKLPPYPHVEELAPSYSQENEPEKDHFHSQEQKLVEKENMVEKEIRLVDDDLHEEEKEEEEEEEEVEEEEVEVEEDHEIFFMEEKGCLQQTWSCYIGKLVECVVQDILGPSPRRFSRSGSVVHQETHFGSIREILGESNWEKVNHLQIRKIPDQWNFQDRKVMLQCMEKVRKTLEDFEIRKQDDVPVEKSSFSYSSIHSPKKELFQETLATYEQWRSQIQSSAALRIQTLVRQWLKRKNTEFADSFKKESGNGRKISSNNNDNSDKSSSKKKKKKKNNSMCLEELLVEKKDIKSRLKCFDMEFKAQHGRMPLKEEKEPMRHLYEMYNDLKALIESKENQNNKSIKEFESSLREGDFRISILQELDTSIVILLMEKRFLQSKLREFKKRFILEHGRSIRYQSDLGPIRQAYKRYKEIKAQLSS